LGGNWVATRRELVERKEHFRVVYEVRYPEWIGEDHWRPAVKGPFVTLDDARAAKLQVQDKLLADVRRVQIERASWEVVW
jgi:hypothetical protein